MLPGLTPPQESVLMLVLSAFAKIKLLPCILVLMFLTVSVPCVPGGTASACSGSSVANISRAHSDGNLSSAAERIRDSKVRKMNVEK